MGALWLNSEADSWNMSHTADWKFQLQKWSITIQADNGNDQCKNYSTNYEYWVRLWIDNTKIRITRMGKKLLFSNIWIDILVPAIQDKSWYDDFTMNRDKFSILKYYPPLLFT